MACHSFRVERDSHLGRDLESVPQRWQTLLFSMFWIRLLFMTSLGLAAFSCLLLLALSIYVLITTAKDLDKVEISKHRSERVKDLFSS